jgi:hypothetical protein
MDCTQIKAGDRVWIGVERYRSSAKLHPVSRVTNTLIVVAMNAMYEQRFRRSDGYRHGHSFMGDSILGVANKAQCREWDAKVEQERQDAERKRSKEQALEKLCLELCALFIPSGGSVSEESWGDERAREGKWTVAFHGLSEVEVRALAATTARKAGA